MYVGAASQHVLRMSFVSEQEAHNFDRQVMTFWSHLMHRDISSPLFFYLSSMEDLEWALQFNATRPWQSIIPTLMATTQSPDTGSLFSSSPQLRAQLAQLQTTLSQQMNKPTFQLKPLGTALRLQTTQKKQVSTIQRNIHRQIYNSLTDTPTEQAILLSQSTSHTEAYEVEDRCFRVSVARRLMLPHRAAANPVICNKPVDPKQHHFYGCRYGGGVDRRHAAVERRLADVIQSHSGVKVFIEQEVPALSPVLSMDRLNTLGRILSSTLTVQLRIWKSLLLLLSLAIRPWFLPPAQNQDMWPRERRRPSSTGTHTSISFLSFWRPQVGLAHMPGNSLATSCEMPTTRHLPSGTHGPPFKVYSTAPSPNNNSRASLRDS